MRTRLSLALCTLFTGPALAGNLDLTIEIPQLDVAEYHRPYVAVWLEREDRSVAANLAVWYQLTSRAGAEAGTKWLPDLRQWWRRSGRELAMPVDGVSGATRPVGEHQVSFATGKAPLGALEAGRYRLVVEAAREEGGREQVDIAFEWPAAASQQLKAQGKNELGAVTLALKP